MNAHLYDPTTHPILEALCGKDIRDLPSQKRIPVNSGLHQMIVAGDHYEKKLCAKCQKASKK